MNHGTNPTERTTPAPVPSPLVSLIEDINPLSADHPLFDLYDSLRQLHSTLEVLHLYTWRLFEGNTNPDDIRIVDVLESTVTMAARSRDHVDQLDAFLTKSSNQLKIVATQRGEEVQA